MWTRWTHAAALHGQDLSGQAINATRFQQNPLVRVDSSPTLGVNLNGPTVIRVPDWVERPLRRY